MKEGLPPMFQEAAAKFEAIGPTERLSCAQRWFAR